MITKKEMLDDIQKILGVELEWHDNCSCLFDLVNACKLANKYKIKLCITGLRTKDEVVWAADYGFSKEDMDIIKENQNYNN